MLYTGQSEDGSDAIQAGVYLSPDGKEWSSEPYTEEQKQHEKDVNMYKGIITYLREKHQENKGFDGKLLSEYHLVLHKKSKLTRKQRDWLVKFFEDGND